MSWGWPFPFAVTSTKVPVIPTRLRSFERHSGRALHAGKSRGKGEDGVLQLLPSPLANVGTKSGGSEAGPEYVVDSEPFCFDLGMIGARSPQVVEVVLDILLQDSGSGSWAESCVTRTEQTVLIAFRSLHFQTS